MSTKKKLNLCNLDISADARTIIDFWVESLKESTVLLKFRGNMEGRETRNNHRK